MSASESQSGDQSQSTTDPTRTVSLRREFNQESNARFERVRGDVRETVEANDAFGVAGGGPDASPPSNPRQMLRPAAFDVSSDAQRRAAFREWFDYVLDQRVLKPRPDEEILTGAHWTSPYVRRAVLQGITRATVEARKAGYDAPSTQVEPPSEIVQQEQFQSVLEQAFLSAYQDVETATNDTFAAASRAFTAALVGGVALRVLANRVNGRVDAVGQTRGIHYSTSIVVRTVNRAALHRYDQLGVDEVSAQAESVPANQQDGGGENVRWSTAGDRRVCDECRDLADNTYAIADVLSGDAPMPVRSTHPSCRCFLLPA